MANLRMRQSEQKKQRWFDTDATNRVLKELKKITRFGWLGIGTHYVHRHIHTYVCTYLCTYLCTLFEEFETIVSTFDWSGRKHVYPIGTYNQWASFQNFTFITFITSKIMRRCNSIFWDETEHSTEVFALDDWQLWYGWNWISDK
jgi:hypothetical protein